MNQDITTVFPLEILLNICSFLNLTEIIELSKANSYCLKIAKLAYIDKVIKSKLIMEINLGTEQPINIRYECTKFNRNTEQTIWKPTCIIGTKNRRSVNTKEKVILRKVFFENEPYMTDNDNFNLIHMVKGEMDIKDSGIECIKGEESLIELKKNLKKNKKYKKIPKNKSNYNKNKKHKIFQKKSLNIFSSKDNFKLPQEEMIKTELSPGLTSRNSICSTRSSPCIGNCTEGYMVNNHCLLFYANDMLIKDTIRWSFEYKVESVKRKDGDSWQKLQPSKLKLPFDIFFQNKQECLLANKKSSVSKFKSIVKKNMINVLEKFSNSFVGVI